MHTKTTFYVALLLKLLKLYKIVYFTAFNTTIPHASTSAIYHLQYFYNFYNF
jgi:hypothetical protein